MAKPPGFDGGPFAQVIRSFASLIPHPLKDVQSPCVLCNHVLILLNLRLQLLGGIQCRVDLLDVLEHLLIERRAVRAIDCVSRGRGDAYHPYKNGSDNPGAVGHLANKFSERINGRFVRSIC